MRGGVQQSENMKICLLGASFDTGNLGVSALAESTIKIILSRWPDARITILGSGYVPMEYDLNISGRQVHIETIPVRVSKNIFLPYHFLKFVLYGLLTKMVPGKSLKEAVANHNKYFRTLYEMDLAVDITGGDSFSDIYGFRRFFIGFLRKWLVIFLGKKFVLLPQTYGPFKGRSARLMARYIFRHAAAVYARDNESLEYARTLLGNASQNGKVRLAPDVAFVLDPRKPADSRLSALPDRDDPCTTIVGLNINGLLYGGGYTRNNMFALNTDYPALIHDIIELLMRHEEVRIVLVPHVFPPAEFEVESDPHARSRVHLDSRTRSMIEENVVESDPHACSQVHEALKAGYRDRISLPDGNYDHNEIKYIIGLCDFFIGSRMHSCIAAISQGIPTVGLAYSRKFAGVFDQVGIGDLVVDLRAEAPAAVLWGIEAALNQRMEVSEKLAATVPGLKAKALAIFDDSRLTAEGLAQPPAGETDNPELA